jgi:hypothetical protein
MAAANEESNDRNSVATDQPIGEQNDALSYLKDKDDSLV